MCAISATVQHFVAATEVVLVRFREDDTILKDLVYLEEEAGVGAGTPLERARRAVWGMLYADDAGAVCGFGFEAFTAFRSAAQSLVE